MAAIIFDWIENELKFPEFNMKTSDPDTIAYNFSNGYILGQILFKMNQLPSGHLSPSFEFEAKVQNFIHIEPALRALNVPFGVSVAISIINQIPGEALKLLYQMKVIFLFLL